MSSYVLGFQEIDKTKLMLVGGKGLNLGELSRIEGLRVPEGFCVTTEAYQRIIGQTSAFNTLMDQLSLLKVEDRESIREISQKLRRVIEGAAIAKEIVTELLDYLAKLGEDNAYAVRSSATAEDLPQASFAGQQDTYLNIIGQEAILEHVRKCWASLFTDRAVTYRIQNGFDHRKVYLSVVIQRMIFPEGSGIMFTADPVTSNRKVLSIDAGFGLGEALVSGLVNADIYKVREGKIVDKKISTKKLAIYALEEGGTEERETPPERQNRPALTDEQILQLTAVGRKIEAFFGRPQDIEWCFADDTFYMVQSRPITTLYPVPVETDGQSHVYMSMGHQQMMTEVIRPLGIAFFQLLSGDYPFRQAGGRLFVDLSHDLASPIGRMLVRTSMGKGDPLMQNAILSLTKRKAFIRALPRGKRIFSLGRERLSWRLPLEAFKAYRRNDAAVILQLISNSQAFVEELRHRLARVSGDQLFTAILESHHQLKKILYDPRSMGTIMAGLYAAGWLNKRLQRWLGEKSAADILSQSVPHNVTSEMGLALLDVSDVVRRYPAVINYFNHADDGTFFEDLAKLEGGPAASDAIGAYLAKYGMRCSGEIDITRPRWSEQPTALLPVILSNIKNFEPHAHQRKFEQGLKEAGQKEEELLSRLTQLSGGKAKVSKTRRMIRVLRNLIGYREYPKYFFISCYHLYKQALLKEANRLVEKGIIREREDCYFLYFEEFREAVRAGRLDPAIIARRKAEYATYEKLSPPRVMTSDGEIITGEYRTDHLPAGTLPGLAVSAGVVEGRARVILKMEQAAIEEGDILVTVFTDPSWTPLFVSVKGLVTEVGGLMTHGAVIAREYGLPAVVGLENATKLIKDGQRIRVNGTDGYVEIL